MLSYFYVILSNVQIHVTTTTKKIQNYFITTRISFMIFPLCLIHCVFLALLWKIICPYACSFTSELSVPLHWSVCMFFFQYHSVLICCFVVLFEVRECDTSSFVLLSQGCFGFSGSFVVLYKLDNFFALFF